ncbi:MAG: transcriptional repressor [Candidatus Omnitrophica bacterium]|nr:transcriptional repressor [Candidatus Omnitrophota bacterium]
MLYGKLPTRTKECKEQLHDMLKGEGIRDKRISSQIVDIFLSTEQHVSASDFSLLLQKKSITIDEELVSISLMILAEFGFAIERQFEGEDIKRYEHLHPRAHHDHFICIKCKNIIEFSSAQLEKTQESLIFQKGWKPLFHKLEVYGVCDDCSYTKRRAIPISFAQEDTTVRLSKIEGGRPLRKRLTELGFVKDEMVRIVKNSNFGPIIVEVKGARFAIGRGQANKMLVYEK